MVHDHFALLNQPRQPWLDPEQVQASFVALSGELHPDRVHNAPPETREEATRRFAQLNAACQCLKDSKERLRHLLELERGVKVEALERLPFAESDFYFQLGRLCREVDQFLNQRVNRSSPLLAVRWFEEAMRWKGRLDEQLAVVHGRRAGLESQMRELNAAWEAAPELLGNERAAHLPLARLEELYRELSYLARWSDQLRERVTQLACAQFGR
jgi:curved DNA-binding protein CbpA